MNERCPLSTEPLPDPNIDVPDTCRRQCEELFTQQESGVYYFDSVIDEIAQENCGDSHGIDLEYVGEGLQAREGSKRMFSVSDGCRKCGSDYVETVYVFDCPYHEA